jgi:hypothetical protein
LISLTALRCAADEPHSMIVAWHREILGGVIAASSLAAFHALLLLDGSRPAAGWWFLVFASPALALLSCGLTARFARS